MQRTVLRPDLYGGRRPLRPTTSMPPARRNMRCSRCCWHVLRGCASHAHRQAARRRLSARPRPCRLAEAAAAANAEQIEREFFDLFIGVGRGELMPYASYYLTGLLHERPLARLRADLSELGIARASGQRTGGSCRGPVRDHGGLGGRRFNTAPEPIATSSKNISRLGSAASSPTWKRREAADFYRRVGVVRAAIHRDRE